MRRSKIPLIALDFDGVIHASPSAPDPGDVPGLPVPETFRWIGAAYFWSGGANRLRLAVFSTRNRSFRGRSAMRSFIFRGLRRYNGPVYCQEMADWIEFPFFKPPARIFVDDKAFRFEGSMPPVEELLAMDSWCR